MPLSKLNPDSFADSVEGNPSLIINGDMAVAQRGSSFSFAHDGTTIAHTLDRFRFVDFAAGEHDCTVAQVSDAPSGFSNSLKVTTGTAESTIHANEIVYLDTKIEAQNLQHLNYGTSSAKKLTLSFWVKSSVTGTYGVNLYKPDPTARVINGTYTIDTASTWEYKTITFDGDTDSGATIDNNNGAGLWVSWHLASGSNYDSTDSSDWIDYVNGAWAYGHTQDGVITTASATWQLTGAKLEVGSVATSFLHESYAENLAKCQRYYYKHCEGITQHVSLGDAHATFQMDAVVHFPVTMRATPTLDANSGTGYWGVYITGVLRTSNAGWTLFRPMPTGTTLYNQGFSSLTLGHAGRVIVSNASAYMAFDAEL